MTELEFSKIIDSTRETVLNAIRENLPQRFWHAIDDVAQETYLRAYKGLTESFRGESSVSTWLYAIARNESYRIAKKLHREEKKAEKLNEQADRSGARVAVMNREGLFETLKMIPPRYREVLQLYANGWSEKEIALELNIRRGTVKSRASRGREWLTRLLFGENHG